MGYIVLSIAVLILDIMTKLVVELNFGKGDSLPLWNNVFHLKYVENQGIAFGLFSGARWIFVIVSVLIMVFIALIYSKTEVRSRWLKIGTAFIYGGAFGNMLERLAKGYVVDFFDFRLINFPVFNVADIAICAGAVMVLIHFLIIEYFGRDNSKTAEADRENESSADVNSIDGGTENEIGADVNNTDSGAGDEDNADRDITDSGAGTDGSET